jgi:uncharacterized membrane protein
MEIEKLATIALIILSFAIGLYVYPMLPENVASHWGASGEVNGYLPAFWGAFLIPALSAVLFVVFLVIPLIDPLSENIKAFRKDYLRFVFAVILFLSFVHVQTLLWNLGTQVRFNLTLPVLLGLLFFYTGHLLGKLKRNWFIGIRTPWTMSSDEVWDKTHKLGGALFKAVGVVSVLSILLPIGGMLLVIALIIAAAIAIVVYSYLVFRKMKKPVKKK